MVQAIHETALTQRSGSKKRQSQITDWMVRLVDTNQVVALWVKQYHGDGHKPVNLGGYYTADRLDDLVVEAVRCSGHSIGVHWSINPIDPCSVEELNDGLRVGGGAVNDDMVLRRRWLPIDVDPIRSNVKGTVSATEREKLAAEDLAYDIADDLAELDWPSPIWMDTGNGFCLLYRVDLPADDDGLIRRFLRQLTQAHDNDRAKVDTKVGDPGRVVKVPGTWACKGHHSQERPHRPSSIVRMLGCGHGVVSLKLLQAYVDQSEEVDHNVGTVSDQPVPEHVIENARRYIAQMPPALQGERGHDAALNVAQRIVVGFNIPHDSKQARKLLLEWNDRCDPPWTSDDLPDLLRKLQEADRLATENREHRGELRSPNGCRISVMQPLNGKTFVGEVPDYLPITTDSLRLSIRAWESAKATGMLRRLMVWQQQRSDAVVPDILAREVIWGADAPKGWLRNLRSMFDPKANAEGRSPKAPESDCPPHCPLHGSVHRHRHFSVPMVKKSGLPFNWPILDEFFVEGGSDDGVAHARKFHFNNREKHWRKNRSQCQRANLVRHTFALPLYFGFGRKLGITRRQARLWLGISGELTRVSKSQSDDQNSKFERNRFRVDRAEAIEGGRVVTSGRGSGRTLCPVLDPQMTYVTFAGNNRSHAGKGYPIVSAEHWCWLDWAGYEQDEYKGNRWEWVKSFLADLEALTAPLELVVVARHHERDHWKGLDELQLLTKSGFGREWLEECRLRIFAPEDFLVRWRYFVAQRLGFQWIPGGSDPPFALGPEQSGLAIADGHTLVRFLERNGMSQSGLADTLGVRRETVNRHVQGRSNSSKFWQDVTKLAEQL